MTTPVTPVTPGSPFATNQDLDPVRLREAFGIFPTGVVAVAAQVDHELVGLAASSFTSVSLDPPLVSVSVASGSRTWPLLRRATHIGVTVLAEHHGPACRRLAGPVPDRFTDLPVHVTDDGAAVLSDGLAALVTTVYDEVPAGDHTIVLLRLHAVHHPVLPPDASEAERASEPGPLVFHRSRFGALA